MRRGLTAEQAWEAARLACALAQIERQAGHPWRGNVFGQISDSYANKACALERRERPGPILATEDVA